MPSGIFNPFKKPGPPKKDFVGATDPKNPLNTEYEDSPKSTIRLDGDSYVLQLDNIDMEEVNTRLEAIIRDLWSNPAYQERLVANGVRFAKKPELPELNPGEMRLETPRGYILVYAGDNGKEVDCFRRLAYTLYLLPIKELLAKHKAKAYKRG